MYHNQLSTAEANGANPAIEPKVSVIVCTHNRGHLIKNTLDSLIRQTLSQKQYEIIIVNNASTDNTEQVCAEYASNDFIRYVEERVLGLSHARNTGWLNARAEIVAYIDDDAIASPLWLDTVLKVFDSTTPRPAAIGGRTVPKWSTDRPHWLTDPMLGYLGCIDWGDTEHVLQENEWLVGANIAYDKKMFLEHGGFDPSFGRSGDTLGMFEETLVNAGLQERGHTILYCPSMVVHHQISDERLHQEWFLKAAYELGRYGAKKDIAANELAEGQYADYLSEISSVTGQAVVEHVQRDKTSLEYKCNLSRRLGYVSVFLTDYNICKKINTLFGDVKQMNKDLKTAKGIEHELLLQMETLQASKDALKKNIKIQILQEDRIRNHEETERELRNTIRDHEETERQLRNTIRDHEETERQLDRQIENKISEISSLTKKLKEAHAHANHILSSLSYRIGRIVTYIPRKTRALLRCFF